MTESARVAVFNSNDDTLDAIREVLEESGFRVSVGHVDEVQRGKLDLVGFLKSQDPHVVVWDVSPPYEQHWTFLGLVRDMKLMQGRELVVTSTNVRQLESITGARATIEVVGKPFDLGQIRDAICKRVPKLSPCGQ